MLTVETFDTLDQAAAALRDKSCYLGGGTLVMRGVNYGDQAFDRLLRVRDGDLRRIRTEGSRIVIGAGVTMAQVIASPELEFLAPVARSVGGPALRNMATVAGNLFARSPFGDFATALLALGATVHMSGRNDVPIDRFLGDRDRQRGLVASVSLTRPQNGNFRYRKISRTKPKGAAVMSIAAVLPGGGRVSGARIAFGAMGPTPLRACDAEAALEGASLDRNGIQRALAVTCDGLDPQDDALASAWYRREVAPVHLSRLLLNEEG